MERLNLLEDADLGDIDLEDVLYLAVKLPPTL